MKVLTKIQGQGCVWCACARACARRMSDAENAALFTLMVSPSISTAFSLKSTPIVASVLSGKLPPVKRNVRQVFPTLESPMTMILKMRVWMLSSWEARAVLLLPLLDLLRTALWKSTEARMVTSCSARFQRFSSGNSLVIFTGESDARCVVRTNRRRRAGWRTDGSGKERRRNRSDCGFSALVMNDHTEGVCDIHKTVTHNYNNVINTLPKYSQDLALETKAAKSINNINKYNFRHIVEKCIQNVIMQLLLWLNLHNLLWFARSTLSRS